MASHNRLSILVEGVLLTTLLLSLSFSPCNATSRSMGRMDSRMDPLGDHAGLQSGTAATLPANSCAGRESCQTTTVFEQDPDMMHPEMTHSLSSVDSVASLTKISDPRMSNHEDKSEWVRSSDDKNMMYIEHLRESNPLREDQASMTDSERMREDSERMRDSADRQKEERMRDPRIDRMGEYAERMSNSVDTMSDINKRISDQQRSRDSQRTREDSQNLRDSETVGDSDRMRVSENMRDSDRMINSDGMRDSHGMIDSDEMRDSRRMIDSDRMRDSHRMIDSDEMRDSHRMMDRTSDSHRMMDSMSDSQRMMDRMSDSQRMMDRMSDSQRMMDRVSDSHRMANSDRMIDSDGLRDSRDMGTSDEMRMMDHESSRLGPEEMLNSERRTSPRDSERLRDSNQMMDQEKHRESSENMRNSEWKRAELDNAQNRQSEMMRDSDRIMASEGRTNLENARAAANNMMDSAAAQRRTDLNGEKQLESEMIGDAEQMNDLHRRGDLERRRDLERMTNSDNMQGSQQMSAKSHRMRNSESAPSRMGHMERQHSSTMELSSCQGRQCRSTSDHQRMEKRAMDQEALPLSSRRLTAEIIGSRSENSEAAIDSSKSADMICSGMNTAECDAALNGKLQGSFRNMHISETDDLTSSCRLNGADSRADCRMTANRGANNNPRSMETSGSTTPGRMNSCSNDHCRISIANNEEPMAESQRPTRNDREIVASPKWMKLERQSSTINDAKAMDNSEKTSPMANNLGMTRSDSQKMKFTAAETTHASRDRHLSSIEAENWSSKMHGSEMQDPASNHWTRSTAEVASPGTRSCTNEGDCRSTSKIMHMSHRDSKRMRHGDEEINGQSSCANEADCKSEASAIMHMSHRDSKMMRHGDEEINGQSSCTNGADCRSTSRIMHVSTRDSETMGPRHASEMTHAGFNRSLENGDVTMDQEMADDSKMMRRESDQMNASAKMMHDSEEAAAETLPIHRGN